MTTIGTLKSASIALRTGEISSRELTEHYLSRIEAIDGDLNSFTTVTPDRAREDAAAADETIATGSPGPLTGVPIAHKDIFCTQGIRTSCGSKMLDNFAAPYNATVVEHLAAAGMVMLGKTNMDEFAMGSSNETSFYGPVHNPWDAARVPGGSSGGSAAAVAAALTPAATGTDTGGSIRQPSAFCGISGLKPTYGRVSRWGMVAFASSLDQGGPMARTVADAAMLFAAMAGFDPKDSTSARQASDGLAELADGDLKAPEAMTIGLPGEYFQGLDPTMQRLFDDARGELERQGHRFVDVSLHHTSAAVPVYYVVASAEASTNLSRYDGVRYGHRCKDPKDLDDLYERSRSEGFGREVKRRILTGTYALSVGYFDAYYLKAQRIRRLIRDDFLTAFEGVDAILTPTAPSIAFPIDALSADPISMYQQDVFTTPASLAGVPALTQPCGFIDELPVGMQLIGPHFAENLLLRLGHAYQQATPWHEQRPDIAAREVAP
jgi:aspartyl-tRNA(Asn)/glutamyl-tRNA(Gln) amidotransferase subunit A